MSGIKYIGLVFMFFLLIQQVKLYMLPFNKFSVGKKCVKNNYDFLGIYDYISHGNEEKNVVEKLKNALECFNMEVFTDCENSLTIPFEEYIDNVEFYFIDFIKFYINYVNATMKTIFNRKIFNFILNPASVLIVFMYLFYLKSFRPIIEKIETELKSATNSNADFCSTPTQNCTNKDNI